MIGFCHVKYKRDSVTGSKNRMANICMCTKMNVYSYNNRGSYVQTCARLENIRDLRRYQQFQNPNINCIRYTVQ